MPSRLFRYAPAITIFTMLATSLTIAQPTYSVTTLPTAGGVQGQGISINERGWVVGIANFTGDNFSEAALWLNGNLTPLGNLGGPNSAVAWPVKNNNGIIVGISETADMDPLGESGSSCHVFFATFPPDGHACQGFRWQNGHMTPLPTLGGTNSYATAANNRGQIVGWAENTVHDPTCSPPSTQVLQFRAVIWGPGPDQIQELPPLPGTGDTVTAATAINDRGQVVGISGICDQGVGRFSARHAVLWENGVPMDLGSLGGKAWNTPAAINNQGTVVGFADVPGDDTGTANYRAFIWTRSTGMQPLPALPGETRSAAFGINNQGQIVGSSRVPHTPNHAVLWENGTIINLNQHLVEGSPTLNFANDINDSGTIVGEEDAGPAYVAVPVTSGNASASDKQQHGRSNTLPVNTGRSLHARWGIDPDDEH
jgi:probable HAF family extracellular repeat protein